MQVLVAAAATSALIAEVRLIAVVVGVHALGMAGVVLFADLFLTSDAVRPAR